ncbi:MAG TPA: hypothetical protein VFL76_07490 [Edaphocola sp.]|nr:hypothetical protein [Edaphocola sp.]
MEWKHNISKVKNSRPVLTMLAIITGCLLNFISCRKPDFTLQKDNTTANAQSMTLPMQIDMQDVYAALPQSILYNLGDSATFYVGQSTYSYTDSYLVVHIPTSQDGLGYIYAAKSQAHPERTLVYAVRFFPDDGSTPDNFSGKMEWFNFQNGTASGIKYKNGVPQAYTSPVLVVEPGWEQCMIDQHQFAIDDNGKIIAVDGSVPNNNMTGVNVATITGGGPLDCPKWGESFGDKIGDFFSGLGSALSGIFQDGGGGSGGGGGWFGGIFGFPDGIWLPWPDLPGGGGAPTPPPGNDPPGSNDDDNPPAISPAIPDVSGGPLYSVDDPGHGPNPGNPVFIDGGVVVGSASQVQQGGAKDVNGFYYSRIMALQVYLQAHPYAMLDCGELGNLPSEVHQEVGNYQIPQSVTNRIQNIRNTYSPQYNQNNFYIQKLENAHGGVVNCDYFPVHITQLPKNSNNQTMTPLEYLEYFRQNITYIAGLGGGGGFAGTNFESYYDSNVNFFDSKFTENYGSSLGALVHIIIGPAQDNGTIVESGYQTTSSSNQYWFMFTTMYSPLDAAHPVAGNRRFGIKPDPNGGYTLYIMGVDRTNDWSTTILNVITGVAFSSADALWNAVQDGVISDVNSNGGQAALYTPRQQLARPKWNKVKNFLEGQISLQELKNELNCP